MGSGLLLGSVGVGFSLPSVDLLSGLTLFTKSGLGTLSIANFVGFAGMLDPGREVETPLLADK